MTQDAVTSQEAEKTQEAGKKKPLYIVLIVLLILAFLGSVAWLFLDPDFEPMLSTLVSLAALIEALVIKRRRWDIAIAALAVAIVIGGVIVFVTRPKEINLAVYVANDKSESVGSARCVLFFEGQAFSTRTDGAGAATFTVKSSGKSQARLFVETEEYEIADETITMTESQMVEVRLVPKNSDDHRVLVRVVDDLKNEPVSGAEVIMLISGSVYTEYTDANGLAKFTLTFQDGMLDADLSVGTKAYKVENQLVSLRPDEVQDVRLNRDTNELMVSTVRLAAPAPVATRQTAASKSGKVEYGQTISGEISAPLERDQYTLDARAGDIVTFKIARTSGDVDVRLRLMGPDGTQVTSMSYWMSTHEKDITMPSDGEYTILIDDNAANTRTGEYLLSIQPVK